MIRKKCCLCGTCEAVCFRHLIKTGAEKVDASLAELYCAECGQCQAVCPTGALIHSGMEQGGFVAIEKKTGLNAGALIELLKTRRSHRNFKTDPVSEDLITHITQSCSYAPSSSNDSCLGLVIIRNPDMVHKLSGMAIAHLADFAAGTISQLEVLARVKQLEQNEADGLERARKLARFLSSAAPEQDPILYHAPLVLLVHSSPYTNFPKENAMVAAHSAMLTAHALGLGTCYISLMAKAANEKPRIKTMLEIPAENEVHAVICMGHPKYRYRRTTPPRTMPVKFVGD